MNIFERAAEFIRPGDVVGLGSGRAARGFIELLAARVQQGLAVRGVATSRSSEQLAQNLRIPLVSLEEGMPLAITVDGADEVDLDLDLIKGYGRALVREKIVASASRMFVILVGKEKAVPVLGSRGKLPVEVIPFAVPLARTRLRELGLDPVLHQNESGLVLSDNCNAILDCGLGPIDDPHRLEQQVRGVPGVVATGLFLGMAHTVLIGDETRNFELIEERQRNDQVGDTGP
jgi:ribose 5-phosphate isomerase A